jgi:hypothetical protein
LSPKPPVGGSGSITRLIACSTPSGPNEIHGSVPRSNGPPPGVQRASCGGTVRVNVKPPFVLTAATLPLEPPFE